MTGVVAQELVADDAAFEVDGIRVETGRESLPNKSGEVATTSISISSLVAGSWLVLSPRLLTTTVGSQIYVTFNLCESSTLNYYAFLLM